MLDEPLGALDRALRERLLVQLGNILRSMQQTALYVTHDQEEAFSLADRVIIMEHGGLAQIGTPQHIYHYPASEFVARFLGFGNILVGNIQDNRLITELGEFKIGHLALQQGSKPSPISQSARLAILIRPDAMRLDGSGTQQLNGTVLEIRFRGNFCRLAVRIEKKTYIFDFSSGALLPQIGNSITLSFNPEEAIQILG